MKNIYLLLVLFSSTFVFSQNEQSISGKVIAEKNEMKKVDVILVGLKLKTETDSIGNYKFENLAAGNYKIQIKEMGFKTVLKNINLAENANLVLDFDLQPSSDNALNEVVISGTLKPTYTVLQAH